MPRATFRKADMTTVSFPPQSFDAICSILAVIHVPREEHRALFRRMHRWLKPGGILLVALGNNNWVSSDADRFMGVPMYWSQFDVPTSKRLLEDSGFQILESSVESSTFGGEYEEHLYVLAAKASTRRAPVETRALGP